MIRRAFHTWFNLVAMERATETYCVRDVVNACAFEEPRANERFFVTLVQIHSTFLIIMKYKATRRSRFSGILSGLFICHHVLSLIHVTCHDRTSSSPSLFAIFSQRISFDHQLRSWPPVYQCRRIFSAWFYWRLWRTNELKDVTHIIWLREASWSYNVFQSSSGWTNKCAAGYTHRYLERGHEDKVAKSHSCAPVWLWVKDRLFVIRSEILDQVQFEKFSLSQLQTVKNSRNWQLFLALEFDESRRSGLLSAAISFEINRSLLFTR